MSAELRIAVVGAGRMGSDHISRIRDRMKKARLTAVIDINEEAAAQAIEGIEGAKVYTDALEALDSGTIDAVLIATPGFLHEAVLIPTIERGLPILCEKPLTTDSESAWRVVEAEVKAGKKLVQVGFNRRFDAGYQDIKAKLDSGEYGELLQLNLEHVNPDVPDWYTGRNLIDDTVVHEFDAVRYFTNEEVSTVQVRAGKKSADVLNPELKDPALVLMETTSGVLVTVNTHVVSNYGYQVTTRAITEKNHLTAGIDQITEGFVERFQDSYDREVQAWIDAALAGEQVGPSAWDGYAATACCEAGIEAVENIGSTVTVKLNEKPDLYK